MVKYKKKHGFMDSVKEGLGSISQIVSSGVFPRIAEGTEMVIKNIDSRIIHIEKRIMRKLYSFSMMLFGAVFLIFAIFFYLKDYLGWSNVIAFFSIGIIIFVIGLLLKIRESTL